MTEKPGEPDVPLKPPRELAPPVARSLLALWAREGKWAEIALSGQSMSPLIPDGTLLTVRFGRQGLRAGDIVLYSAGERLIAHRVLRLGRRGRRWGYVRVKGDPVRSGEAAWVAAEEILGRAVALRRPDGRRVLLNTLPARFAGRLAALISSAGGIIETRLRPRLGRGRDLRATPFLLRLLEPLHRLAPLNASRETLLTLRPEERLLIAAARLRMTPAIESRLGRRFRGEIPWERLRASASSLGLAPLLYRNLSRPALSEHVPAEIRTALARSAHAAGIQTAIQIEALGGILARLEVRGIEPVLLKGSALALTLYDQPALRSMQDLDLLVRETQVPAALETLEAMGYRSLRSEKTAAFYAGHHHAAPMIGGSGRVVVEVHRGLVPPSDGLSLDPAPLFRRAVRISAHGLSAMVLSREDQVLHACLHLSFCDRFVGRLRDLLDIDALVESEGARLDWGRLLESAPGLEAARSLHATLDLARRLLGSPVPPEFLNELARAARWDPVAPRLLRALARSSLFASGGGEGILPIASAKWCCDTLLKRARWSSRVKDLVMLLGDA